MTLKEPRTEIGPCDRGALAVLAWSSRWHQKRQMLRFAMSRISVLCWLARSIKFAEVNSMLGWRSHRLFGKHSPERKSKIGALEV